MIVRCLGMAVLGILMSSCGHIYTKSEGYTESSKADLNGAQINAAFKPNGGKAGFSVSAMVYMAGSAKLEGPFLWRVQAQGKQGVHESMIVHRVKVMTSKTNRREWFPVKYLGGVKKFEPYKKTPDISYAYFQMPGELKVMPDVDGKVKLLVDVTIKTKKKSRRKVVSFNLAPSKSSDVEFIFLPTEIVNSLNKDPREWKVKPEPIEGF